MRALALALGAASAAVLVLACTARPRPVGAILRGNPRVRLGNYSEKNDREMVVPARAPHCCMGTHRHRGGCVCDCLPHGSDAWVGGQPMDPIDHAADKGRPS